MIEALLIILIITIWCNTLKNEHNNSGILTTGQETGGKKPKD
jgi:hypothetical protein